MKLLGLMLGFILMIVQFCIWAPFIVLGASYGMCKLGFQLGYHKTLPWMLGYVSNLCNYGGKEK